MFDVDFEEIENKSMTQLSMRTRLSGHANERKEKRVHTSVGRLLETRHLISANILFIRRACVNQFVAELVS